MTLLARAASREKFQGTSAFLLLACGCDYRKESEERRPPGS
jgi:hypothetical protein